MYEGPPSKIFNSGQNYHFAMSGKFEVSKIFNGIASY